MYSPKISRSTIHQKSTCPMASVPNLMNFLANGFSTLAYIPIYCLCALLRLLYLPSCPCLRSLSDPCLREKSSLLHLNFHSDCVISHLLTLTNVAPGTQSDIRLANIDTATGGYSPSCFRDTFF